MRLEGWNAFPAGYLAWLEINRAPWWLRLWFRISVLDKFAHPIAVHRGFGRLTADPGWAPQQLGDVGHGRQIAPHGQASSRVVVKDRPIAHPGGLRRRRRQHARQAWWHHVGRGFTLPTMIRLPGGRVLERRNYLFWQIRLPMLAVFGVSGTVVAGWPGLLVGLATALLIELLFSYRRPYSSTGTGSSA